MYKSCLYKLLRTCTRCSTVCDVSEVARNGSYIRLSKCCPRCEEKWEWESQPLVGNAVAAGNLVISAAILFHGLCPTKVLRMLKGANIAAHCIASYHNHARTYLHTTIWQYWCGMREDVVAELAEIGSPCKFSGDGRADSPGHSAKYGTYSLIENHTNKVVHFEVVQVSVLLAINIHT